MRKKNVLLLIFRNALTSIADLKEHQFVLILNRNADAAFFCKMNCVYDKVAQNLHDSLFIGICVTGSWSECEMCL